VKAPTKERLNLQQDPKTLKWSWFCLSLFRGAPHHENKE
jgi:hypothetical protein